MLFAGSNGGMFGNVPGMFGNGFGGKQEVSLTNFNAFISTPISSNRHNCNTLQHTSKNKNTLPHTRKCAPHTQTNPSP